MNARSAVRLFALLANGGALDGVRLLSEERMRLFSVPRPDTDRPDTILGFRCEWGPQGFGWAVTSAPSIRTVLWVGILARCAILARVVRLAGQTRMRASRS